MKCYLSNFLVTFCISSQSLHCSLPVSHSSTKDRRMQRVPPQRPRTSNEEKKMKFFFPKKFFNKSQGPRGGGCAHTVSHTRVRKTVRRAEEGDLKRQDWTGTDHREDQNLPTEWAVSVPVSKYGGLYWLCCRLTTLGKLEKFSKLLLLKQ